MSKVAILTHSTVSLALPLTRVHFRTKEEKKFFPPGSIIKFLLQSAALQFLAKISAGQMETQANDGRTLDYACDRVRIGWLFVWCTRARANVE